LPGEDKLIKKAVRVNNTSEKDRLAEESRVNYSKLYTIEHNIKVSFIGKIHDDSKHVFFTEVKRTLDDSDEDEGETEEQSRS
jgi:hypothetical protein